jgi:hypothetical protein
MKNIHLIPTDKPSRLYYNDTYYKDVNSTIAMDWYISSAGYKPYNIYITNLEEIKEGVDQWYLDKVLNEPYNSGGAQYSSKQNVIILTTDQDLIKDGVQAIDDEFLEWFVKNPSCEEVEIQCRYNFYAGQDLTHYKIIIPKEEQKQHLIDMMKRDEELGLYEEPKQETIEEAKEIEKQITPITPEALIELGFKKQYADRKDGFWLLDSQKFYFTIDFKTMTPSIHLKGYGHIQKLTNATTIEDIKHLIRLFA